MKFTTSSILRAIGLIIVLGLILVLVVQFLPKPSAEEIIEATVAAGVEARSTEVAVMTGTVNPTQIQSTVNARVEATLTAAVPTIAPTPASAEEQVSQQVSGIALNIWNSLLWLWNLAGFAGIWSQICCCILPIGLIFLGVAGDSARR
jgi:Asp-tRNA(Asn)/Glu-tRNA(Gln) amidotransferase A subunit family amidase